MCIDKCIIDMCDRNKCLRISFQFPRKWRAYFQDIPAASGVTQGPCDYSMHTVPVPRDEDIREWAEVNQAVMLGLPGS